MNHDRIDRLESLFAQRLAHHTMVKYLIDHGRGEQDIVKCVRQLYRSARRIAVALDEDLYYEPRVGMTLRNRRSGTLFCVMAVYQEHDLVPIYDLSQTGPYPGANRVQRDQVTQDELFRRYRLLEDIE